MDAPIVEFPRSLCEGVECCRRPQEDTFQPDGERLDGLGHCTGLSVDLDDVGSVARAVVFGEAGHSTLLQLFDPLNLPLKAIADVDGESGILGIEDIPLRASLEGVGMGFNEVFEPVDSGVELAHFGRVVVFSLFDRFEQGLGDALQGVGVKVGTTVEDVSG